MNDLRDLVALVKARTPLIIIESMEEPRVVELLGRVADRAGLPCFTWTVTEGLLRRDPGYKPQRHNSRPTELFGNLKAGGQPGLYLLLDMHHHLDTPTQIRMFKEIVHDAEKNDQVFVLCGYGGEFPAEISLLAARYELTPPAHDVLKKITLQELEAWSRGNGNRHPAIEIASIDDLVMNLSGLSEPEARRIVRRTLFDDGALTAADMDMALREKYRLLNKDGVLTFEHDTADFANVGGLSGLKEWLKKRTAVFKGTTRVKGLPKPKGILLLGVQGCGKSLAAKGVAGLWNVPLLHLDFGALYNKYHGETERNLRESLKVAQAMKPCVLWIDEIEKGIGTGNDDSGTSKRVLGTFLTWMAEREPGVFLVATANDIASLPPELIRKGRLDEIFFVDLPDPPVRREIFTIHLQKRDLSPDRFDLDALVAASEGFSGAEIEQAIVAALYSTLGGAGRLDTGLLLKELDSTRPLSVIMSDRISALRDWARERTVPAG